MREEAGIVNLQDSSLLLVSPWKRKLRHRKAKAMRKKQEVMNGPQPLNGPLSRNVSLGLLCFCSSASPSMGLYETPLN